MAPSSGTTAGPAPRGSPWGARGKPSRSARSGGWRWPRYRSGRRPSSPKRPPTTPSRWPRSPCRPGWPPTPLRPRPLPRHPRGGGGGCARGTGPTRAPARGPPQPRRRAHLPPAPVPVDGRRPLTARNHHHHHHPPLPPLTAPHSTARGTPLMH